MQVDKGTGVWAGKFPVWFFPSWGSIQCQWNIIFNQGDEIHSLLCKILSYGTPQRPALSCTRNKRTVIAAPPHNITVFSSLLTALLPFLCPGTWPWSSSPLLLPAEEPGASPGHSCLLSAAGHLCPGTRQGKKCLGKAVLAFAEGFPNPLNIANLTIHANCNNPGISVGRGATGAECWEHFHPSHSLLPWQSVSHKEHSNAALSASDPEKRINVISHKWTEKNSFRSIEEFCWRTCKDFEHPITI